MAQKYMTTVDVRESVRMYESGMSLTKIGEVIGFSRRTLSKQNYAHYATPKTIAMTLLVAKLHQEEELSVGEIAELVGRSWTAVQARLRRAGAQRSKQEGVKVLRAWSRKPASEHEARAHRARKLIENYRREYGAL